MLQAAPLLCSVNYRLENFKIHKMLGDKTSVLLSDWCYLISFRHVITNLKVETIYINTWKCSGIELYLDIKYNV